MAYFEIKGVIPPMATPFQADGSVDYDAFVQNIHYYNTTALAGYLVLGSNSETPFLNEEEKLELIRLAVQHAAKDKIIMVGTGLESTEETIRLTNKAAKLGAHCALLLTPNYYGSNMNEEVQIAYFTEVADRCEIPILIYNVTKFTHINISPAAVSILSKHPNIIGMKDSSGDIAQLVSFITKGLDPQFNLIVGTASAWYPAQAIGVKAAIMALANCSPKECIEVQTLVESGRWQDALELYKRMFPVNAAVTGKYGVPGLKYAMNKLGLKGCFVRKPLLECSEAAKKDIDAILTKAQLL